MEAVVDESAAISLLYSAKPVIPRDVSLLYEECLVLPMVPESFEKDAASE